MFKNIEGKIYKGSKILGNKIGLDLPYFIKNGFWVMMRQVVGSIGGLLLSVVFARLATQEVFGQYQFVLSILSIVSILSIPGLNTALVRSVARGYDGDYRKVVRISFLWSLLGIPVLLGVGGYYYLYQSHPLGIALMISSIFFPFFYAPNTWDSFLQGKSRFDVSAKYSSIQIAINTVATIGIIFFSRDNLIPIIIVYLISYTFFNGYYFWKSSRYISNNKKSKDVVKYGWFLTKVGAAGLLIDYIDRIILGVVNIKILAIYAVALNLIVAIKNVIKGLFALTFPKFSKTNAKPSRKNWFVVMVFALSVTLAVYMSADNIIILLFTENYREAIPLLKEGSFLIIFFMINSLFGFRTFSGKYKKKIYGVNLLAPLITIVLSFLVLFVTKDLFLFVLAKLYLRQILNLSFFIFLKDL